MNHSLRLQAVHVVSLLGFSKRTGRKWSEVLGEDRLNSSSPLVRQTRDRRTTKRIDGNSQPPRLRSESNDSRTTTEWKGSIDGQSNIETSCDLLVLKRCWVFVDLEQARIRNISSPIHSQYPRPLSETEMTQKKNGLTKRSTRKLTRTTFVPGSSLLPAVRLIRSLVHGTAALLTGKESNRVGDDAQWDRLLVNWVGFVAGAEVEDGTAAY